jgi:hypothetical protein
MVITLGLQWLYSMETHRAMFRWLIKRMSGREPLVECGRHSIWTSIIRNKNKAIIFVMNLYSSPQETWVKIADEKQVYLDEKNIRLSPMEIRRIIFDFAS